MDQPGGAELSVPLVLGIVTATFFMPETKGKTLEEIEAYFERKSRLSE